MTQAEQNLINSKLTYQLHDFLNAAKNLSVIFWTSPLKHDEFHKATATLDNVRACVIETYKERNKVLQKDKNVEIVAPDHIIKLLKAAAKLGAVAFSENYCDVHNAVAELDMVRQDAEKIENVNRRFKHLEECIQVKNEALRIAQNQIASMRPGGSSDPESKDYCSESHLWDTYQHAIDI